MRVLVLGGGDSPEREVSFRSAINVSEAARAAGFDVSEEDPKKGIEFLDSLSAGTIVFPVLHGKNGEDGTLQLELEKRQLPYLGSTYGAIKVTFDKWATLQKLKQENIPTAQGASVKASSYASHPLAAGPHVLKVNRGGSSIGTVIVRDKSGPNIERANEEVFSLDYEAVLEELVDGIEITVPILDQGALQALEIRPPDGGEFDYKNKYNGKTQELCPPPSLSKEQHKKAKELGEAVHRIMGCRHLSRVDMIIKPDGTFVVLEINSIPGLSKQSLYPKSAKVAGMDMPTLVTKFVEMVKRDYNL